MEEMSLVSSLPINVTSRIRGKVEIEIHNLVIKLQNIRQVSEEDG